MPSRRRKPELQKQLFASEEQGLAVALGKNCRDLIRKGDVIRASGGPSYNGEPLTKRAVYQVDAIFVRRGRTWLDCTELVPLPGISVRHGVGARCGRFLLYVCGKSYRNPDFPGVLWEPFRVKKVKAVTESKGSK